MEARALKERRERLPTVHAERERAAYSLQPVMPASIHASWLRRHELVAQIIDSCQGNWTKSALCLVQKISNATADNPLRGILDRFTQSLCLRQQLRCQVTHYVRLHQQGQVASVVFAILCLTGPNAR